MRKPAVVVFEYGAGNVHSVCHALEHLGAQVTLTANHQKIRDADGLLVPGVGAFGYVMDRFRSHRGEELLHTWLAADKPFLGVCVGMQILFQDATEKGDHQGVRLLSGTVEQLPAAVLPHVGWTRVQGPSGSQMFEGVDGDYFYFVHSYARLYSPTNPVRNLLAAGDAVEVAAASYGGPFVAAVETGNVWATQFHPEKSGRAGLRLLDNWLKTVKKSSDKE